MRHAGKFNEYKFLPITFLSIRQIKETGNYLAYSICAYLNTMETAFEEWTAYAEIFFFSSV